MCAHSCIVLDPTSIAMNDDVGLRLLTKQGGERDWGRREATPAAADAAPRQAAPSAQGAGAWRPSGSQQPGQSRVLPATSKS